MKSRPILFNSAMVRALLNGTKTQTRRIVKPQPCAGGIMRNLCDGFAARQLTISTIPAGNPPYTPYGDARWEDVLSPYGRAGDRLWVKETHAYTDSTINERPGFVYRATDPDWSEIKGFKWKPSIFCTRQASRITLELTDVRVKRLNDISEADAQAEGCERPITAEGPNFGTAGGVPLHGHPMTSDYRDAYRALWESINGAGSWALSPWVWVLTFRRVAP